jgi:hypothetical protein
MRRGRPSELVLFVDVKFWENPKVVGLTALERERWLWLLAEQLKTGSGRELPEHAYGVPRKRIARFLEAGLLDEVGGRLHVHDWDEWNGHKAYKRLLTRERVRRFRERRNGDL